MTSLSELSWPEVDGDCLLVIPLGSTEQHGPHLPLSTDTDIALRLAQGLALRSPGTVVAPALPYGASGEHAGFPGTLSIGTAVLERVIIELVRSADLTASRILLLNGHGGNSEPLRDALRLLRSEGRDVRAWAPAWRGDAHAGRTETSLQLAGGARVGPDRPRGAVEPLTALLPQLRAEGVRAVSPNGVLGDATDAHEDEGHALISSAVDELVAFVETW